jgi:predicted membrane-bound spermidine synthase
VRPAARALGSTLAGAAFFLSGAAGLVYQVSWQRILALHSGVGVYSIAIIVAAFLFGLGLGSFLGGRWSVRFDARRALRAFGLVELGIAACGLLSCAVYYDWLYQRGSWLYGSTARAAVLHTLTLLPPTLLMGMSLPFLVRARVQRAALAGRTVGLLYAVNVLGASAGAALTPWVLVRSWGIRGAVAVAAGANALAGLTALLLSLRRGDGHEATSTEAPDATAEDRRGEPAGRHPFGLWLALYGLSGFLALALEITWFRLLDVAVKATAFTFGTLLALYLLGMGLGCLAGAFVAPRLRRPLRAFLVLQCVLAAYSGASVAALAGLSPDLPGYGWLVAYWSRGVGFKMGIHDHAPSLLALYGALPAILFGPPTFLMGLAFPALQRAVHDDVRTSGRKVGLLQAANIAGCVAGSVAVGLVMLQWLGTAATLRMLMGGGLVFAVVGLRLYGPRSPFPALAALLAVAAFLIPDSRALWLRLHGARDGRTLVAEDATSVCAIVPWADDRWAVFVNGHTHSWLPFGGLHTQIGAAAAVVHPGPRDVAIIGLGSGDTAWAAGCRPETRALTVFEIAFPQPALLSRLARTQDLPALRALLEDPRLRLRLADGRNALTTSDDAYDVIEADALRPEAGYAGNLYSVEFFQGMSRRLRPGGVMCTWSPTGRVYASFVSAFPHVLGTESRNVLIGSHQPLAVDKEAWRARLYSPAVVAYLGRPQADEVWRLLDQLRPVNLNRRARRRRELNLDLFPRDEFLSPGG